MKEKKESERLKIIGSLELRTSDYSSFIDQSEMSKNDFFYFNAGYDARNEEIEKLKTENEKLKELVRRASPYVSQSFFEKDTEREVWLEEERELVSE